VTALPPTWPVTEEVPEPVTAPLASTAKGAAAPRLTVVVCAAACEIPPIPTRKALAHPATRTAAAPRPGGRPGDPQ
jgi:hypothetical protein